MPRSLIVTTVLLVAGMAVPGAFAQAVPTGNDARMAATHLRHAKPELQVRVSIGLRTDDAGVRARLASGRRAAFSTIVRQHNASDRAIAVVREWAAAHGLRTRVGRARTRVIVTGSASRIEAAFRTSVHHYRDRRGRTYVASPRPVSVPAPIAGVASSVAGLDHDAPPVATPRDVVVDPTPVSPSLDPTGAAAANPPAPGTSKCATQGTITVGPRTPFTPFGLAQQYGIDQVGAGARYPAQTVAVIEIDQQYSPSDVNTFQQACRFGAGAAPIQVVQDNLPGAQTAVGIEAQLDAQWMAALAPSGTKVVVINAASSSPTVWSDAFEEAASLPNLTAVSISYGSSEMCNVAEQCGPMANIAQADTILTSLAASGVSIFVSAGDQGSMGPPGNVCAAEFPLYGLPGYNSINWPASSLGVTAVGGTLFTTGARSPATEQVWNEAAGFGWACGVAGGGGGQSVLSTRPAWQTSAGAAIKGTHRLVPDVALLAGVPGYLTLSSGSAGQGAPGEFFLGTDEGTSASAPVLAAAVLRINADRLAAGRRTVGFLNPTLYGPIAAASGAITDITTGNNDIFLTGTCCTAATGYDTASGLGSPNVATWERLIP